MIDKYAIEQVDDLQILPNSKMLKIHIFKPVQVVAIIANFMKKLYKQNSCALMNI